MIDGNLFHMTIWTLLKNRSNFMAYKHSGLKEIWYHITKMSCDKA